MLRGVVRWWVRRLWHHPLLAALRASQPFSCLCLQWCARIGENVFPTNVDGDSRGVFARGRCRDSGKACARRCLVLVWAREQANRRCERGYRDFLPQVTRWVGDQEELLAPP